MQATIEPTFGEHPGHEAMLFEKQESVFLVSLKEPGRRQNGRQDLGGAHLGLWIIILAVNADEVRTKAANCDNLFLHGCPLGSFRLALYYTSRAPVRLAEAHFVKHSQGSNLI